jgi:hypothetical protein
MCQSRGCCLGSRTFACLDCKTTAKGAYAGGGLHQNDPKKTNKTTHPNCPKCRKPMTNLGLGAAIPRKAQWKKLVRYARRFA